MWNISLAKNRDACTIRIASTITTASIICGTGRRSQKQVVAVGIGKFAQAQVPTWCLKRDNSNGFVQRSISLRTSTPNHLSTGASSLCLKRSGMSLHQLVPLMRTAPDLTLDRFALSCPGKQLLMAETSRMDQHATTGKSQCALVKLSLLRTITTRTPPSHTTSSLSAHLRLERLLFSQVRLPWSQS